MKVSNFTGREKKNSKPTINTVVSEKLPKMMVDSKAIQRIIWDKVFQDTGTNGKKKDTN